METLEQKIARVTREEAYILPYDPAWPYMFEEEKRHLVSCLPSGIIKRIEHFGSTSVPGLSAKPVIDMLVIVTSLDETKKSIVPVLESLGYDYFWRPTKGDDTPPFYAWFIKRDKNKIRTHHIHMIEPHFEHFDRLYFRDYLRDHPETAQEYGELKMRLCKECRGDRIAYTNAKSEFIEKITGIALKYYGV
jgi:GrpB-like predicted nucleotidyltransferase (UPF0157 family)